MITEKEFKQLKQEVEDAKEEASRAKGALDQLMSQLETEFDCKDLKEAKELLAELTEKRDKAAREFERAMKDYEKKWKKNEEI